MPKIELEKGYKERPMAPELDLISRLHGRFKGVGLVMPAPQRRIYERMMKEMQEVTKGYRGYPQVIHKPSVVDVGCGVGIGANILSQEAQFVWGIDNNRESIEFARQMFERRSDNIYYTPQLTFDVIDATNEPREMQFFDFVVCVEVIEHVPSKYADQVITFLKRFIKRDKNGQMLEGADRTKIYLTAPNRNNPKLQKDTPFNEHHCYEPTPAEMYSYLTKHFRAVTVLDDFFEPQELNTTASPLVYKLELPI